MGRHPPGVVRKPAAERASRTDLSANGSLSTTGTVPDDGPSSWGATEAVSRGFGSPDLTGVLRLSTQSGWEPFWSILANLDISYP